MHPGQAHLTPHVQPDPASDLISLIGGMDANSGIGVGTADEDWEDRYSNGARSGPGAWPTGEELRLYRLFEVRLERLPARDLVRGGE